MAMITLTEAGERIGFKYITLWGWCKTNKIPYYDINGSYRIDERDLEKFISEKRVEAVKVK